MDESMVVEDKRFPATAMPDDAWWSVLWPHPERIVRTLGIEAGMTVVDLCCGNGYFTAPLAKLVNGKVYALDIDPEMLDRARRAVARRRVAVAGWLCADVRELAALVPHEIDFVLIANTFHGVPDKTALARAVARVLKPGGRLAIVNWHRIARAQTTVLDEPRGPETALRMSPEDVRKVVEPAGFRPVDVIELPPYHYGAVFRKSTDGAPNSTAKPSC